MDQEIYKRIGQRIKDAREKLGLSQSDLAEKLDYNSAATISHFESGIRKVSIEDLYRIAQILSLPLEYFYSVQVPPPSRKVRFRATEVSPSVRTEVTAFLAFAQNHSSKPIEIRFLTNETRTWQAATEVLKIAGVEKPPVLPEVVAEKLNIPLFEWNFPDEISGAFASDQGKVCIGVNQNHPRVRQRFTIAHELGHFIFNDGEDLFVDFTESGLGLQNKEKRAAETKANYFAADLLMPKVWLLKDFEEFGTENITLLAQRYQVSEQALWFRLINLGFVSDNGV